jgi:Zn-dependent protease with chaperone function
MIISNIWSRFTTPVIFNLTVTGIIFGLMMGLALLALIILLMIPISWILEFRADINAAKAVGAEHVKSALLKLTEKEKIMLHSETHPSTYERIKHIESKKYIP